MAPYLRLLSLATLLVFCLNSGPALSQTPPPNAPKTSDIIAYLMQAINWYRGTAVEQQVANELSDLTFLNDDRRISVQIVRLAFDFARLEEKNESTQLMGNQPQEQSAGPSQYQRLSQVATRVDQQIEQSQKELQALRQKLETTPQKKRPAVESLMAETQSELAFQQARRDALRSMLQFTPGAGAGGMGAAGLRAQIEELERSVPAVVSGADETSREKSAAAQAAGGAAPSENRKQSSGIWGIAAGLFRLSGKGHTLDQRIESTDKLVETAKELSGPLLANLKNLIRSGDELSSRPPSDNPTVLAQQKKELDALTSQFKQTSAALLPLHKQGILLSLYKKTLTSWRASVGKQYRDEMRSFVVRLAFLIIPIAAVFALGEVWRRSIFRYISEKRRRYQFLLFRKIVIWVAVGSIVLFTFAAELGSVATFAGLLTAGVAVALQNVILSVAGYFFLIGKYGVRVGDRVEIAGVTGEVVDIGLVRLHMLELGSGGTDAQPSGRVVAFSNSIVFQPASGVFRQIPGTSFVWHEISLTFSAEDNSRMIRERMAAAVDTALKDYHEEMERQMHHMQKTLNSISAIELRPGIRLQFTASGIEVTVHFPVGLRDAEEIDDHVMREIYSAIEQAPKLTLVGSGMPTLRTDISTPPPP
jgi:small-conductance mechanosensitive channel